MRREFSIRLVELIEERNIPIKELAKEINISKATVDNWLKGRTYPNRLKPILALSNYLNVSVADLKFF